MQALCVYCRMEGEGESGRRGRSGEGWKPKSERRLEERKGKMRERRKTGEEGKEARGEEEKEASRSVQFNDRSSHFTSEQTEDLLRSLFVLSIKTANIEMITTSHYQQRTSIFFQARCGLQAASPTERKR